MTTITIISTLVIVFLVVAVATVTTFCIPSKEQRHVTLVSDGRATFRSEKGVKYLSLHTLLMVDWDPITEGETDTNHYTITSIQEVETILNQRVVTHRNELWKAYLTPSGGVHAFLLSHLTPSNEGVQIIKDLRGDLLYAKMTLARGTYSVRVSPKIVEGVPRKGDYVAKYWKTFGIGTCLPENDKVMTLHDSYLP